MESIQILDIFQTYPELEKILDDFNTKHKKNQMVVHKYLNKNKMKKLFKIIQSQLDPYWSQQYKRQHGSVNFHIVKVMFCMYTNELYDNLSKEQKNIALWSALLHDIVKRGIPEIDSYKDTFHPYLSAIVVLEFFDDKNFFSSEEKKIKKQLQELLYQSKYCKQFPGSLKELICYKSIDLILVLSQQILKSEFAETVFKITAFHQSLSVLKEYPNYSVLSAEKIYSIFSEKQLQIYKLLMICDSQSYGRCLEKQQYLEQEITNSFWQFENDMQEKKNKSFKQLKQSDIFCQLYLIIKMKQFIICFFFVTKAFSLYLHKKLQKNFINQELKLFIGLDNNNKTQSTQRKFFVNFNSSHIYLSSDYDCSEKTNCYKIRQLQGPEYNANYGYYIYDEINSFLGLRRIVSEKEIKNKVCFLSTFSMNQLNKKSNFDKNILGLSPKSKIWDYWSDIYHLVSNNLLVEISTNEDMSKFIIWNLNIKAEDVYFQVNRQNKQYNFQGQFQTLQENSNQQFKGEFCLHFFQDNFFILNSYKLRQLKQLLCENQCKHKNDLIYKGRVLQLYYEDFNDTTKGKYININTSSLYQIDQQTGAIQWLIKEKKNDYYPECDFILGKYFLNKYKIKILFDKLDRKNIYVSINNIQDKTFCSKKTVLRITKFFFVISFVFAISYSIYSKFYLTKRLNQNQNNAIRESFLQNCQLNLK